jgi:hypothetical protein
VYVASTTWLSGPPMNPAGSPRPASAKAMRRPRLVKSRGCGAISLNPAGLSVGDPCFDPSYSPTYTHCMNPVVSLFDPGGTSQCSAAELACLNGAKPPTYAASAITLTPQLSAALAPGLPAGYDPTTGLVDASNTTGETVPPSQSDIQAALTGQLPDVPAVAPSAPWSSTWLVLAVVAIVGVAVFAGKR